MKDLTKTLIFVVVALVLTGAAMLRIPERVQDVAFNEQGKPFFPDFKDPFACSDLEVISYEPSTATASRFEVKFKDGKWVIPSHYDYPADAKDRLAKTSAAVMDLTMDAFKSDRVDDQEAFGVIDPLDPKSTSLKGRGKRVTLRDKTEKVLADFIIGDEVKDHAGQRYVRVPGHKQIYAVNVKADLSTKFADWIETNLLKLDSTRLRRVKFDNYKVDPERRQIIPGDVVAIERKDSSSPWTIQGQALPPEQEMNTDKLSSLTTALADLKIVGVRPKPEGLQNDLKVKGDRLKLSSEQAFRSLYSKGFYLTPDGLRSNQGDVIVSTDEGVVYTLRFGEVVVATGLELTAGADESASKEQEQDQAKPKDASKKKNEGASESRYVMVTVAFDPSLLPPEHPPEPEGPLTIPDDPFQKKPDDPKRIAEEKADKEKREREAAHHKRRLEEGEKRAKELTDRFAAWYYVTPGDSFRSIALGRADLTRKKDEKKPPTGDGAMPSFPGLPQGLTPPGHP